MMEWDDKVARARLTCHGSGRDIAPGERFFSCLEHTATGFERRDFSAEAWAGVADQPQWLSWWRSLRPPDATTATPRIDHAALLSIFHDLKDADERSQRCFAWVLALLLLRARKLRFLDLQREGEQVFLVVEEIGHRAAWRLRDPGMDEAEQVQVEADLRRVLGLEDQPAPKRRQRRAQRQR